MTRSLTTLVVYADYSCPTTGERNGRVFHWHTEDVLGWSQPVYAPAWVSDYFMSSLPTPTSFEEYPCGARFAGPRYQSGLCAEPASFAYDGGASATARIPQNGLHMGSLDYNSVVIGSEITIYP